MTGPLQIVLGTISVLLLIVSSVMATLPFVPSPVMP